MNYVINFMLPGQNVLAIANMPSWSLLLSTCMAVVSICIQPFFAAFWICILPKVVPGVYHTWSFTHFIMQTKASLVNSVGTFWSATMYWPWWLWLVGANIGSDCEIDNVEFVPELVTTGDEIFCADPII